jgi:ABC-2 type transport system ATP-binding protein
MTAREQLDSLARLRGGVDVELRNRLCERFALVLDRPIRHLSKGNRQKVGLVQAFMHRPELVVLDEPSGGLDPLLQAELRSLLRETAAEGRTVFLSIGQRSHAACVRLLGSCVSIAGAAIRDDRNGPPRR